MVRIFVTGDNHIGKKYANHDKAAVLSEKRITAFENMVKCANDEECSIFVITGDLFDNVSAISQSDISDVVNYLKNFEGTVVVLPGNHDYYNEKSKVWQNFTKEIQTAGNIIVTSEYKEYELNIGSEKVIIYPAFCQTKHSAENENNLSWIKEMNIQPDDAYRIGVAHGAIEGLTIDSEGKYFLMTLSELKSIDMDVWLIGHTHVPYPENVDTQKYTECGNVFNAGTHVQTDVSCNTEGSCFIVEIDGGAVGEKKVRAKKFISGNIRYYRKNVIIAPNPDNEENLKESLKKAVGNFDDDSVVDLIISGAITREEYKHRNEIYEEVLSRFTEYYQPSDSELGEIITEEMIKSDFAETSFSAKLLMNLIDDPKEAQMLYDLLKSDECREA